MLKHPPWVATVNGEEMVKKMVKKMLQKLYISFYKIINYTNHSVLLYYRIPSNIAPTSNKAPSPKLKNLTTDMDVSDYLWKLFFLDWDL